MKCKCLRCGHKWTSKGNLPLGRPLCCPGCKSYSWNRKKKIQEVAPAIESAIEMKCVVCRKAFKARETIYRAQEGKNIKGAFILEDPEKQGLYCENCMVPEDVLPFAKKGGG